jgi:hypothetical protein
MFLTNAVQTSDLDTTHLAPNPIKRVQELGLGWNASPYTCTSTSTGSSNTWSADPILKIG